MSLGYTAHSCRISSWEVVCMSTRFCFWADMRTSRLVGGSAIIASKCHVQRRFVKTQHLLDEHLLREALQAASDCEMLREAAAGAGSPVLRFGVILLHVAWLCQLCHSRAMLAQRTPRCSISSTLAREKSPNGVPRSRPKEGSSSRP